jgi:hypothetical protein
VAVVGDAYVVVHAITSGVKKDIENGFKGVDQVGERVGAKLGRTISAGMSNAMPKNNNMFFTAALQAQSLAAADAFSSLTRAGYILAPAITAVVGVIGALGSGLISLVAVLAAAGPAIAVLANGFAGLVGLLATVKIAFSGVSEAISAGLKTQKSSVANTRQIAKAELALKRATEDLARAYEDASASNKKALADEEQAQKALNKARQEAMEQLQQLAFDSEDAAINEQKAAIELEKARETLARVSDLPPNSRARKEAELAFAQADLNYRRAIDKNNDLKKTEAKNAQMGNGTIQDQINGQESVIAAQKSAADASINVTKTRLDNEIKLTRATEDLKQQTEDLANLKLGPGFDAFQDALNNLPASAQEFVKYIVSLKGAFKDLQAAIGDELFPKLEEAIDKLVTKLLPRLKPLFAETGSVLGDVANKIADVLTRADNIERIERIWKTNNKALGIFGDTIANLIDSFLLIADAARPLVIEFANWTKNISGAWKETLEADTKSGKLAATLETAAEVVRRLGKLFRETFGAIGTLIKANVGPGSGGFFLLDYLTNAATKLKNLTEVDGTPLKEFFLQGAVNFSKLLDVVGGLLGIIIKIGASKGMEGFLDALKGAMPDVESLGKTLADSLPAFGKFIAEFIRFVKTVTDSGAVTIFFNTLRTALKFITDFLNTDFGQGLLKATAVILPFILAMKTIGQGADFFGKVVYGNFLKLKGGVEAVASAPAKLSQAWAQLTYTSGIAGRAQMALAPIFGAGMGPIIAIVAAVAALVAVFVLMYQNSETLRKAIKDLIDGVFKEVQASFKQIMDAVKMVAPQIKGLGDIFKTMGDFVGKYIVPLFKVILVNAIDTLSDLISGTIKVVAGLWYIFTDPIKGVKLLLSGFLDFFKAFFINPITSIIKQVNIFGPLGDGFKAVINKMIGWWNSFKLELRVPDNAVTKFLGIGGKGFTIQAPYVQPFAKGGIVQPSMGGTLARIGEAGKPERVEPLDPDGLSKRDKAMIDYMGGAGKGVTIVVNPSAGMDERELAAIVSRQLSYAMRKGAA